MSKMIDAAAAAAKLGVNVQRIRALLQERRISGARLIGRQWFVPEDFKVTPGTRGPAQLAEQMEMIPFDDAAAEILAAVKGLYAEDADLQWLKGIAISVDWLTGDDPARPHKHAREIQIRFGSVAIREYRAASGS